MRPTQRRTIPALVALAMRIAIPALLLLLLLLAPVASSGAQQPPDDPGDTLAHLRKTLRATVAWAADFARQRQAQTIRYRCAQGTCLLAGMLRKGDTVEETIRLRAGQKYAFHVQAETGAKIAAALYQKNGRRLPAPHVAGTQIVLGWTQEKDDPLRLRVTLLQTPTGSARGGPFAVAVVIQQTNIRAAPSLPNKPDDEAANHLLPLLTQMEARLDKWTQDESGALFLPAAGWAIVGSNVRTGESFSPSPRRVPAGCYAFLTVGTRPLDILTTRFLSRNGGRAQPAPMQSITTVTTDTGRLALFLAEPITAGLHTTAERPALTLAALVRLPYRAGDFSAEESEAGRRRIAAQSQQFKTAFQILAQIGQEQMQKYPQMRTMALAAQTPFVLALVGDRAVVRHTYRLESGQTYVFLAATSSTNAGTLRLALQGGPERARLPRPVTASATRPASAVLVFAPRRQDAGVYELVVERDPPPPPPPVSQPSGTEPPPSSEAGDDADAPRRHVVAVGWMQSNPTTRTIGWDKAESVVRTLLLQVATLPKDGDYDFCAGAGIYAICAANLNPAPRPDFSSTTGRTQTLPTGEYWLTCAEEGRSGSLSLTVRDRAGISLPDRLAAHASESPEPRPGVLQLTPRGKVARPASPTSPARPLYQIAEIQIAAQEGQHTIEMNNAAPVMTFAATAILQKARRRAPRRPADVTSAAPVTPAADKPPPRP